MEVIYKEEKKLDIFFFYFPTHNKFLASFANADPPRNNHGATIGNILFYFYVFTYALYIYIYICMYIYMYVIS